MRAIAVSLFLSSLVFGQTEAESPFNRVDFECAIAGQSLQPRHKKTKKPLGRSAMPYPDHCWLSVLNSRNGITCSYTEVKPWFKPTHRNGTMPTRTDYGFWGSSVSFEDCLQTTLNSTGQAVCYWGGEDWFAGDIEGRGISHGGPFRQLRQCLKHINGEKPLLETLRLGDRN